MKVGALQKEEHRLGDFIARPGAARRSRRNKPLDPLVDLIERNHPGRHAC